MQNKALLSRVALIGLPGIYRELLAKRQVCPDLASLCVSVVGSLLYHEEIISAAVPAIASMCMSSHQQAEWLTVIDSVLHLVQSALCRLVHQPAHVAALKAARATDVKAQLAMSASELLSLHWAGNPIDECC